MLCFKKPLTGTYAEMALQYGSGALNVDGGRIGTGGGTRAVNYATKDDGRLQRWDEGYRGMRNEIESLNLGRYPANLILGCCCEQTVEVGDDPERPGRVITARPNESIGTFKTKARTTITPSAGKVVRHTDPNCPAALLDEQTGERPSAGFYTDSRNKPETGKQLFGSQIGVSHRENIYSGETGGASRFFKIVRAGEERRCVLCSMPSTKPGSEEEKANTESAPLRFAYKPKASSSERNAGLDGFDAGEPPASARSKPAPGRESALGRPRANHHPTIKPIDLCRYLATLLLPPDSVKPRRLLVPFAGSGSEMIGAMLAGWDEIVGVEQSAEYVPIAEARLAHWSAKEPKAEQLALAVTA